MNQLQMSEYQLTQRTVQVATLHGKLACHLRPAYSDKGWRTPIMGHAGLPDVIVAGHGLLAFLELKVGRGRLTEGQVRWLRECSVAERIVAREARPEDWPQIEDLLRWRS